MKRWIVSAWSQLDCLTITRVTHDFTNRCEAYARRPHRGTPLMTPTVEPRRVRRQKWWPPRYWGGIAARSAFVSATVVLVAVMVVGGFLAAILYRSLLSGVDDAAAARVRDVVAALKYDTAGGELDPALLATDQRIVAVQVIDRNGTVVQNSQTATDPPNAPLIEKDSIARKLTVGLPDHSSPDGDTRISGQVVDSPRRPIYRSRRGQEANQSRRPSRQS